MSAVFSFVRREIVFFVAAICAAVSAFFVPPSPAYLKYIDWDTLFILFALMGVIGALRKCGAFDSMARIQCSYVHSVRAICALLIILCFFISMLITNDVALLTFVPFTFLLIGNIAGGNVVLFTVVLETIAANTGSMLTPLGNPQNLFLFSKMNAGVTEFMRVILPYSAASFILLCATFFFFPKVRLDSKSNISIEENTLKKRNSVVAREIFYGLLFILCILCVLRIVPKWISAAVVFAALIVLDRKVLRNVDYMLLLTFTAFFIFTGNIASIPQIRTFLQDVVSGNNFAVSALCSQVISNVPATLLLYPFAGDVKSLLAGVNVGGLGTLVASLASLISFKLYSAARKKYNLPSSARYMLVFTLSNIAGLFVLCAVHRIIT